MPAPDIPACFSCGSPGGLPKAGRAGIKPQGARNLGQEDDPEPPDRPYVSRIAEFLALLEEIPQDML